MDVRVDSRRSGGRFTPGRYQAEAAWQARRASPPEPGILALECHRLDAPRAQKPRFARPRMRRAQACPAGQEARGIGVCGPCPFERMRSGSPVRGGQEPDGGCPPGARGYDRRGGHLRAATAWNRREARSLSTWVSVLRSSGRSRERRESRLSSRNFAGSRFLCQSGCVAERA